MPKSSKRRSRNLPEGEIVVPDRLYFRIGEVSRLCRLPTYVLRFWETEFPQLKPSKSSTGQRMYRKPDVENVLRIKQLLYEEGFTIAGARQCLRSEGKKKQGALPCVPSGAGMSEIKQVRQGLKDILGLLSGRK